MGLSKRNFLIYIALAALVLITYENVRHCGFIDYDDNTHIFQNENVKDGLTRANVKWAFTHYHASQWIPLTWISHMLDVSLFGLDPGPHHLVNVGFHLANVLLLFIILHRMTGAFWQSACVSALFAVHPINVESVAWVAERKNVLNTAFWLSAIWSYSLYAEKKNVCWLVVTFFFMALGLMSKAMIVTLPFALLLLDFWPLRRASGIPLTRLVSEKIPLFLLTFAGCWIQISAGLHHDLIWSIERSPISYRLVCSLINYLEYLSNLFFPVTLALPYPIPKQASVAAALLSVAIFSIMLCAAWLRRAAAPYALVGLLWFLGTLVPISGIVQAGDTLFANRYAYVPQIGVFIAVVWTMEALLRNRPRKFAVALTTIVISGYTWLSITYVAKWKDTATLFTYCAGILPDSARAHACAGIGLAQKGRIPEAIGYYINSLQLNPKSAHSRTNLAAALAVQGRLDTAISQLRIALNGESKDVEVQRPMFRLGAFLVLSGRPESAAESVSLLSTVVNEYRDDAQTNYWLGRAHEAAKDKQKAILAYRKSLSHDSGYTLAKDALHKLTSDGEGFGSEPDARKISEEIRDAANDSDITP
jgi:tetratricopeptide (TPR) repeat protein